MANTRVYQLAKELDIDSKQVMAELQKRGVDVKTHMKGIENAVADELRAYYNRRGASATASKAKPAKSAKAKAPTKPARAEKKPAAKKETATAVAAPPKPAKPARKDVAKAVPRVAAIPKKHPGGAQPSSELPPRRGAAEPAMPGIIPKVRRGAVAVPVKKAPPAADAPAPAAPSLVPEETPEVQPAAATLAPVEEPPVAPSLTPPAVLTPPVTEIGKPPAPSAPVSEPPQAASPTVVEPKAPKTLEKPPAVVGRPVVKPTPAPSRAPVTPLPPIPLPQKRKRAKPAKAKPADFLAPVPSAAQDSPVEAPVAPRQIRIGEAITVKELGDLLSVKSNEIIKQLLDMGIVSNLNQIIDVEAALQVAKKFDVDAEALSVDVEAEFTESGEVTGEWETRPPVVTVMGHVDHGKTLLLDAIRETNVVERESGGITQHIGAYSVNSPRGLLTFLDTPGHEAFTAMRARGAHVTDIVVLVVAADDGVMQQTREAIAHARAAEVPIVVAVNKIDKPEANQERVMSDLAEMNLMSEAWGGETIFCEVSAKERIGLDNLIEMVQLQAEVLELKANVKRLAKGVVIEAKLDKSKGPVATVLVQHGTIQVGDAFVCGIHAGRVRALLDDRGRPVDSAGPSLAVEVLGLSGVPNAGDQFVVLRDEKRARQIASLRSEHQREEGLAKLARVHLDDLFEQIQQGKVKELNIVLKADVQGSAEVLASSLEKLGNEEVRVLIIHTSVGAITESDVLLASASNALIIGFNVRPMPNAESLAVREKVEIDLYTVIYEAINVVKSALEGMLGPRLNEVFVGRAEVRETFNISRLGTIAGCYVQDGQVQRDSQVRVIRDGVVVHEGKIGSVRRFKDNVREVASGYECGIGVDRFNDVKVDDILELYVIEEEARTL